MALPLVLPVLLVHTFGKVNAERGTTETGNLVVLQGL